MKAWVLEQECGVLRWRFKDCPPWTGTGPSAFVGAEEVKMPDPHLEAKRVDDLVSGLAELRALHFQSAAHKEERLDRLSFDAERQKGAARKVEDRVGALEGRVLDLETIKAASDYEIAALRDFRLGAGAWIEKKIAEEAEARVVCADCGLGQAKWWDGQKAILCRPCVEKRIAPRPSLAWKVAARALLAFSTLVTLGGAAALARLLIWQ